MDKAASVFVSVVMYVNTLVPQANLPSVLGVEETKITSDSSSVVEINTSTTSSSTVNTRIKARVEARGEKVGETIQERKEIREEKREEFKERLQTIKDERKKVVLERLDERFDNINEKRTEHFNKVLDRLFEILEKIKTKNPDATLVSVAESAIQSAQEAVDAQSAKDYQISLDDEGKVGQAARETIQLMKDDFKSVEEKIKSAKDTIKAVIQSLKVNEQ